MKKEFGFIFWLHLILIILIWLSPFWLNWKFILFFIFLYYLQLIIFKDCILTKAQFKKRKRSTTFYWYYLMLLGFNLKKEKIRFVVDSAFPWIILAIALIWQIVFKFKPLII